MEIIKVKLDELIPYKNNAKIHTEEQIEQIKKSIQEFGNNDPIAIDENNIIIEGHGRLEALKQLGYKEAECIRLTHMTEEQKKAYILVHNKLTMNTGFDFEMLEKELGDILDIDMDAFGFDVEVPDDEETKEVIEDEPPEAPEEPEAKLGDIYQLGEHRLMCGDSTKAEDVDELMGDEMADLVFTDPPYRSQL